MENRIDIEIAPHQQFNTLTCMMQLSVETRARPYHVHIEINVPELHDKVEVMKYLASEIQSLLLTKRELFRTVKWNQ
jgi:hypothetical protein